jgi:hypothetical protein
MKYSAIIASILATMALAACEKPTVVAPPAPIVVQAQPPAPAANEQKPAEGTTTIITVPGPQGEPGPQGPQGPQGAPGTDAPKN